MFLHDASNMGRTTTLRQNAGAAGACIREETIAARPLQEIVPLDDLLRAKIIKIDVEGAEWPVLRGLEPMLSRLRPDVSIVVEVDGNALASYGVSIPEFLAFFAARGYRGERLAFRSPALCISGAASPVLPVETDFEMADLVFRRGP